MNRGADQSAHEHSRSEPFLFEYDKTSSFLNILINASFYKIFMALTSPFSKLVSVIRLETLKPSFLLLQPNHCEVMLK